MIDLQIHTIATPHHARWQPEILARAALDRGLSTIAATDHNTMGSVRALIEAGAGLGVRVVAGVEIDSGFNGKLWHTLVYGVPPENTALQRLCASVFDRNMNDAVSLRKTLLGLGFRLDSLDSLDRPANVADVGTALAREHVLLGRVAGENDESAGMRYVLTELPGAYRPVQVDEIVEVAHREGGLVVLAHPGRSKGVYAVPATEGDIDAMVGAGIDGIEVYYPSHTAEQQVFYRDLARRHGLLVTGGSDSHGPDQELASWPDDLCNEFLRAVA